MTESATTPREVQDHDSGHLVVADGHLLTWGQMRVTAPYRQGAVLILTRWDQETGEYVEIDADELSVADDQVVDLEAREPWEAIELRLLGKHGLDPATVPVEITW